jgi:hypothetical protein
LSGTSKDAGKKRKPKNNIAKSNSSFISRCIVNENMSKRLQERAADGYFAFANINRAFQWLDLSSPTKVLLEAPCYTKRLTRRLARTSHQDSLHQGALSLS